MKKVITDGTKFLTNRFGKPSMTDNINIANVYQENEQNENLISGFNLALNTTLTFEPLNKFYNPFNF